MKILGFEVASGRCSVSISEDQNIIATEKILAQSVQAENLVPMIGKVLDRADIGLDEIDYIAVSNGPGSFTGIRIGLSVALGLSVAQSKKVCVVSNFELINYRTREQYSNFDHAVCIIDAYREQVYMQVFNGDSTQEGDAEIYDLDDAMEKVQSLEGKVVCSGSGAFHVIDKVSDRIALLPRFPFPDSRTLCKLTYAKITSGNFSSALEPLYIRLPDAKIPSN